MLALFSFFLCRVFYHAGRTVSAGTPVTLVDLLLSWSLPNCGYESFFLQSSYIISILPVLMRICAHFRFIWPFPWSVGLSFRFLF